MVGASVVRVTAGGTVTGRLMRSNRANKSRYKGASRLACTLTSFPDWDDFKCV